METKELATQTKKELSILWVEDEDVIRENVGSLIELTGHKCDLVSNGKTALEFLNLNTYDLVVTDIGMHGMNGWELAKIIKEKYDGKMVVAVASGWIISEEEKIEFGIKYVLTKPFTFLQLKNYLLTCNSLRLADKNAEKVQKPNVGVQRPDHTLSETQC